MNTTVPLAAGSTPRSVRPAWSSGLLGLALVATAVLVAGSCSADPAASSPTEPIRSSSPTATDLTSTTARPATSTVTPSGTVRPAAPLDRLVGPEAAQVHVRCTGSGEATVVLIAGFSTGSESWVAVEPDLTPHTRVCAYDRPGTGASDPARTVETFATQAADLHALLGTVGEPGPYVLVGHSFGGAAAVTFASTYPDEVVGLVLVDATPPNWPTALCSVDDDGSDAAAMLRATCTGDFLPTGNSEHLDVQRAFAEVAGIGTLGQLPTAVITAVDRELPGLAATQAARLTQVWDDGQNDWVALSSDAHLVSVPRTGHHIELERPDVVVHAIRRLLASPPTHPTPTSP